MQAIALDTIAAKYISLRLHYFNIDSNSIHKCVPTWIIIVALFYNLFNVIARIIYSVSYKYKWMHVLASYT